MYFKLILNLEVSMREKNSAALIFLLSTLALIIDTVLMKLIHVLVHVLKDRQCFFDTLRSY